MNFNFDASNLTSDESDKSCSQDPTDDESDHDCNRIIDFGRYKGKSYGWTLKNKPTYCEWVLMQSEPSTKLENLQRWLLDVSKSGGKSHK